MTATTERIPFYSEVDKNFLYFQIAPELADVDNLKRAFSSVGRVQAPELLNLLFCTRTIEPEVLTAVVGGVWSNAEYPENSLEREEWLEMFSEAGYTVDGKPVARPTEPLTLYRGATDEFKNRMCWTSDIATAKKFASDQMRGRLKGKVWTATVEPIWLLAHNTGRDESEYVVDPMGLDIQEAEINV